MPQRPVPLKQVTNQQLIQWATANGVLAKISPNDLNKPADQVKRQTLFILKKIYRKVYFQWIQKSFQISNNRRLLRNLLQQFFATHSYLFKNFKVQNYRTRR